MTIKIVFTKDNNMLQNNEDNIWKRI